MVTAPTTTMMMPTLMANRLQNKSAEFNENPFRAKVDESCGYYGREERTGGVVMDNDGFCSVVVNEKWNFE